MLDIRIRVTKLHKGGQLTIRPGLEKASRNVNIRLYQRVRRNASGAILKIRSGRLYRNIEHGLEQTHDGWLGWVGIDLGAVPYGRIHDLGGMTGRGHRTRIRKSGYMRKALIQEKRYIRAQYRRWATKLVRA